ncbi:phosphotransferase [Candidatus Frankia nodulisporulans]|uniref:phosphotransferase n=1 Tax=Candidatus Frankia nodulisporulans TaxID=2060052 RepID=UPI0013D1ABC7|nr:phosphotransferase [Candidatus Frankia nodulisporulans]
MALSHDRAVPIPTDLARLQSPEWLNLALAERFPGVRITRVTPGPIVSRVSTNARFEIEAEDGLPEGLSAHLCGKGYFTEAGAGARSTGAFEVYFYRDLAATTGVRTLNSLYADLDPRTQANVIITEDVVAQGARFLEPTSEYGPAQVAESLAQLARLHAATWLSPKLADVPWLTPRLHTIADVRGVEVIRTVNFETEIGAGVPAEVRDAERLAVAYRALVERSSRATPWSVIHGDAHVGNLYLQADGQPALLDWQLTQRGPWYLDVGYHIASTLTVEDRRTHERDLLRHYLEHLRAGGVEPPGQDDAWRSLRGGILHGFYLWGITQIVVPKVRSELLRRLGTAAADHDALIIADH